MGFDRAVNNGNMNNPVSFCILHWRPRGRLGHIHPIFTKYLLALMKIITALKGLLIAKWPSVDFYRICLKFKMTLDIA